MGRFVVVKDNKKIAECDCMGLAREHAEKVDGKIYAEMDEKFIHCTNCEHFAWWDGDYMCLKDFPENADLIQTSTDGKFTSKFPEKFNAKKCYRYHWNEGWGNGDVFYEEYVNQFPIED